VEVFTRAESVAVLRARVPRLGPGLADRMGEAVGDLPLAVAQAAAFLDETGMDPDAYLQLLDQRANDVLARGRLAGYPDSVAASWGMAFDRLAADAPAGLVLLSIAAWLAPEPVPLTLFTAHPELLPEPLATVAADPLAVAELTGLLRRRALARVEADTLQLHRLVQTLLQAGPAALGFPDRHRVAVGLLRAAAPANPWNNPACWPTWRQLLPHVLAVTDDTVGLPGRNSKGPNGRATDDTSWLQDRAATYLLSRGGPAAVRACPPTATRHSRRRPSSSADLGQQTRHQPGGAGRVCRGPCPGGGHPRPAATGAG
jgi:hypothetical protein